MYARGVYMWVISSIDSGVDRLGYARSRSHNRTKAHRPWPALTDLPTNTLHKTHTLHAQTGKVGYRVHLANRGDEQEVRPFKVAFDLGNVRGVWSCCVCGWGSIIGGMNVGESGRPQI